MRRKLRKISREDILNTYKIRFKIMSDKGKDVSGWIDVLNNITNCKSEFINIGLIPLAEKDFVIVFIDNDEILGHLRIAE
jgi:hypothetical protein